MATSDPPRAYGIATAADALDAIRYVPVEDPAAVSTDTATMAAAGAALVYAIYHSGVSFVLSMPDPVIRAYATACTTYRVGQPAEPS